MVTSNPQRREASLQYPSHLLSPEDLLCFIESKVFPRAWKACGLTDDDLFELQLCIMTHPKGHPVIEATGGLRKIRFSPTWSKHGKSGSHRANYVYYEEYGVVLLVTAYPKNKKDDLSVAAKKAIRCYDRGTAKAASTRANKMKKVTGHSYQDDKERMMENSVEGEILEALADFTDALEKGEVVKRLTCRQVKLNLEPTHYGPDLVKKTRKMLVVSQSLFARFLGVSPKTVRSWEQGINVPSPMACRFMDEIRRKPAFWRERLREVTVTDGTESEL